MPSPTPSRKSNKPQKTAIVVFGDGYLGGQLTEYLRSTNKGADAPLILQSAEHGITFKNADTLPDQMLEAFATMQSAAGKGVRIVCVVNAIGKTGVPNVDECETKKSETWFLNVSVPLAMAAVSWKKDIPFVHISSGCVFNSSTGDEAFSTTHTPNFTGSYYSETKVRAEESLRLSFTGLKKRGYLGIVRLRIPFNGEVSSRNLFNKLISYDTLVDARNSMTYTDELFPFIGIVITRSKQALRSAKKKTVEIFHATNVGAITHKEILDILQEEGVPVPGIDSKKYITPQELDAMTVAPRSNCVLLDASLPSTIHDAIRAAARQYVEALKKQPFTANYSKKKS